jgi:hypothetical protein
MRVLPLGLVLAAVLLAAPAAEADYYKWTDERGQIHLTDDYYKVPPKFRSQVEVKRLEEGSSGTMAAPPMGEGEVSGPTGTSREEEPTTPAGEGTSAAWSDWSGRGADHWSGRQRDLQAKAADLAKRLEANKEAVKSLSTTRAAYVGGRRQRGQLEAESERLEVELREVRRMLNSGLAEEALRSGVPAEFANSLRGM